MSRHLLIGLALAGVARGFSPFSAGLRLTNAAADARGAVSMGRAERRMADKQKKKTGGKSSFNPIQAGRSRDDVLLRTDVLTRLAELPVFGLKSGDSFLAAEDGFASFYLDSREAELMRQKMSDPQLRVEGLPLSEVFFNPTTRLKAADSALRELKTVPEGGRLVPGIQVPLFCIDGLQTTDKRTGVASLPMFNRKAELLEFANPVYGKEIAPSKVLVTDLSVVVGNMINGPCGLLRSARFFADAKALKWMDDDIAREKTAMFPDQGLDVNASGGVPDFRVSGLPQPPMGMSAGPPPRSSGGGARSPGGGGGGGGGLFDGLKGLFPS